MRFVRHVTAAVSIAASIALASCTAILGDYQTGGGDDASTGVDGSVDAPNSDVMQTEGGGGDDGPLPEGQGDTQAGMAHLTVDHATYDFGTHTTGSTVPPATITVTNTGTAPTAPLTIQITTGTPFQATGGTCAAATLMPNASCTVTVGLDTTTAGMPSGTLTVADGSSDMATTRLAANTVAPGALSLSPSDQDFMSVVTGGNSADYTFTAKNTGGVATGMITTALSGTNPTEFIIGTDGCNGRTLAPMATCTIVAHMTPGGLGMRTASLAVSAMPGGTATANLHGIGLAPASIAFTPTSDDFSIIDVGMSSGRFQFSLKNNGGVATSSISMALGGANPGDFTTNADTCSGQTLAPMATCTINVVFSPTTRGPRAATLTATAGGTAVATVTGTGRDYVTLSVTKNGTGGGTVTGDMIACGAACSEQVPRTTLTDPTITLVAAPDGTSTFTGWAGGSCSGTGTCVVTMSSAQAIVATFTRIQYTLNFSMSFIGPAAGSVSSNPGGISCNGPCISPFPFNAGTMVTLTATVPNGYLYRWTGACAGTGPTCTVTMNSALTETLTVTAFNYTFTTSATYSGNLGGLAGADAKCQAAATTANLPGNYVAWLSAPGVNASSRVGSARSWIRVDGTPFADSVPAMTTGGQIYNPPNQTETGGAAPQSVWSASAANSTYSSGDCASWTSGLGSVSGSGGWSTATTGAWLNYTGTFCSAGFAIYCFGKDLSRPLSFTTTAGRYAFVSSGTFNTGTGLAGADALCQNEATTNGLPGTYLAMLSTTAATAASRFNTGGATWVRKDGIPIASSAANLMAGTLLSSITQHADGTYVTDYGFVHTGATTPNMIGTGGQTCSNWSTNTNSVMSAVGVDSLAVIGFFYWTTQPCSQALPVYCLQQ